MAKVQKKNYLYGKLVAKCRKRQGNNVTTVHIGCLNLICLMRLSRHWGKQTRQIYKEFINNNSKAN